jgi:hypothetical protein
MELGSTPMWLEDFFWKAGVGRVGKSGKSESQESLLGTELLNIPIFKFSNFQTNSPLSHPLM